VSGGSWDYVYGHVSTVADALKNDTCSGRYYKLDLNEHQKKQRHKLAELLEEVSSALHEIEWVDSSDSSYPSDTDAIEALFKKAKELAERD
jgi:hypothetical protein